MPSALEVVLGLVGGAAISWYISSVYYRRSKSESKLAYRSSSYSFLSQAAPSPDIEVTFRGQRVPHITKSVVSIWNDGTTTINGTQIVTGDPLRIILGPPESDVLDVKLLRVTREVNRFSVKKEFPSQVRCDFEWFDPGDGALIEILHSGERELSVLGTLKGIPKGVENLGNLMWLQPKKRTSLFDVISVVGIAILFFLMLAFCVRAITAGIEMYSTDLRQGLVAMSLGVFGFTGLATLIVSVMRKSLRHERKPPEVLRLKEGDW